MSQQSSAEPVCRRRAPTLDELPPVIGVTDAAALLGVNSKTLYEAIARGEVPGAVRVGRAIRIYRDAFLGWLKGGDHARAPRRQ